MARQTMQAPHQSQEPLDGKVTQNAYEDFGKEKYNSKVTEDNDINGAEVYDISSEAVLQSLPRKHIAASHLAATLPLDVAYL